MVEYKEKQTNPPLYLETSKQPVSIWQIQQVE